MSMNYNTLNLNDYRTCDRNPVYEGGTASYQEPPRKLVNTNLRSRDFNSYNDMRCINVGEYLDNAGFELFTDSKTPRSKQKQKFHPRGPLHSGYNYNDNGMPDYRIDYMIPNQEIGGFGGFGGFSSNLEFTSINDDNRHLNEYIIETPTIKEFGYYPENN